MAVRITAVMLALMVLTLFGCDSAPYTPPPASTPLPPNTVAVVSGYPVNQAEFLERRQEIADFTALARGFLDSKDPSNQPSNHPTNGQMVLQAVDTVAVAERYGFGNLALARLIFEYAVMAAAVDAGHHISDEEVQEATELRRMRRPDLRQDARRVKRDLLNQEYLNAELVSQEELSPTEILRAVVSSAEVVITGNPVIDATESQALAYLRSLGVR